MTHRQPLSTLLLASSVGLTLLGCAIAPAPQSTNSAPPQQSPAPKQPDAPPAKASPTESPTESATESPTESPTPSPQATQPQAAAPSQSLSSITRDWNGDGIEDAAYLVTSESPGQADLLIYLSDASKQTKLALKKEGIVWMGKSYGTDPSLSLNPQGSLEINSRNDAIGRDRWQKKITALYENSGFIVAGFTYSYRDTLDPTAGGTCDVNLLTGKGIKDNNTFKTSAQPINLADWSEKSEPKECR